MKLVVGLGNPGGKYARNRHNIGFMAVDEMARGYSFGPWKRRFQGLAAEGQIGVEKCIVLKPGTFMNESGRSVGEAMRFYRLSAGDVIVVHDELDLKPGAIRVKTGGGNAGHNGLKSISAHIGNEYCRVRLGIGHPGDKALVSNYVLNDFSKADTQWLQPLLDGVAKGMARLAEGGEAAFLSEAARGRPTSPAYKPNEATPSAKVEPKSPKPDAAPAALSRPIEAMPVIKVPVFAAREGGAGGVASSARMMSEPEKKPPSADRTAIIMAQPSPAPLPVEAATPDFTSEEPAILTKTAAQKAKLAGPVPADKQEQQGGFLGWWLRKRVRGGAGA